MRVAFEKHHQHGVIVGVSIPEGDVPPDAERQLRPAELRALEPMGGFRRATWVAGRLAIARALKISGAPALAVLPNDRGAPRMPVGFVGSISHKHGMAVAMVSHDVGWCIGIDIEVPEPDRSRIAPKIVTPREMEQIRPEGWPGILRAFSVKEAVYKALDPFVRRYVGFLEVELECQPGLTMNFQLEKGEGPFECDVTYEAGAICLATARVRHER